MPGIGLRGVVVGLLAVALTASAPLSPRTLLGDRILSVTRETKWALVSATPIRFRTFHPQGMVKIDDAIFVSSVEVVVPTKRFPAPVAGMDRDTGEGVGHLFRIDLNGNLQKDVRIGQGFAYHPGGMDYDGHHIWVPVAEYRPDSHSIVYRVDPRTMEATEAFRVGDHIGAVAYDTDDDTLYGASWGSRRFYRWRVRDRSRRDQPTLNTSYYVDYQDCKYAGRHRMLCTGVTELRASATAAPFRLGGVDLIDLRDGRPLHQTPVLLWTPGGLDMTHNPVWIEPTEKGLRAYFMPEDDSSTLYIYETVAIRD